MRSISAAPLQLFSWAACAGTPLPDGPHIVVSGEGKVSARPDSARIVFSFEQRADQALPAKQTVDREVNALLDGASGFDIADTDIRASNLTTSEDVDYDDKGRRVSNGYAAERNVTVVLHDVQRLNDFLDFALASGADDISNVAFESTQASALQAEAEKKAVQNARQKGEKMAAAFGATLGAVYSIDSLGSRYANGWEAVSLDRMAVTGSRVQKGRYLQPSVEYSETVSAVFDIVR